MLPCYLYTCHATMLLVMLTMLACYLLCLSCYDAIMPQKTSRECPQSLHWVKLQYLLEHQHLGPWTWTPGKQKLRKLTPSARRRNQKRKGSFKCDVTSVRTSLILKTGLKIHKGKVHKSSILPQVLRDNAEFTEPLEVSPLKEDLCDDRGVEKKHEEEEKWVWTQSNVPCLAKCTNLIIKYYERL